MKSYGVTIQMKATKQYFPVVLFIMLYKVVLTFESVDEILWCDHSNESYWVLWFGNVYYVLKVVVTIWVCAGFPKVLCIHINFKKMSSLVFYRHFAPKLCNIVLKIKLTTLVLPMPFWVREIKIGPIIPWKENADNYLKNRYFDPTRGNSSYSYYTSTDSFRTHLM